MLYYKKHLGVDILFFSLFKKFSKKAIKVGAEEKPSAIQEEKKPLLNIIGKLNASFPKYKSIEDAIHILQDNEFVLNSIRTGGECSGHDCIDSFSKEYISYKDFEENVYDDFRLHQERIKGAAELDWSTTMFRLSNQHIGFNVTISIGEDNGKTIACEPYFFILKENSNAKDKEYCDILLAELKVFDVTEL